MKAEDPILPGGSLWAPFSTHSFRWLWSASVGANLGLWVTSITAAWLMVQHSTSPTLIAGVQVAIALPGFLLSLPAGSAADRWNRRHLLVGVHLFLAIVAGALGVMQWTGLSSPAALLIGTFLIGCGIAVTGPCIQSLIADIVPPQQLPQAITLSGIAFNTARAVGPSLAGLLLLLAGGAAAFALVAVLFFIMLPAAVRLQLPRYPDEGPVEPMWNSMRTALRYARYSPPVLDPLLRTGVFTLFGAALWALLPLFAQLHSDDPGTLGLFASCIGGGAIGGGLLLMRVTRFISVNGLVALSSLGIALLIGLATTTPIPVAAALLVVVGVAWSWVGNTLYAVMQTSLPRWVRGRTVALYILVAQGGMAGGSLLWGAVAEQLGVRATLVIASAGMALSALVAAHLRTLRMGALAETTLVGAMEADIPQALRITDDGLIAVELDYRVAPEDAEEFRLIATAIGRSRRRDGALMWRLYRDMHDACCWRERFLVESWSEYLRLQSRKTQADREFERRLQALHQGDPPKARYSVVAE